MRARRLTTAAAALTGAALILSACSGGGDDGGGDGTGEVQPLTIHANSANTYQRNFNPFSASVLHGARGYIYEPLVASSPQMDEPVPWLAESVEFNDDGTVMTYTLREDVTWSDGEDFTAEDVAFTFNLFVDEPATNLAALDVVEARTTDDLTVEIEFSEPMFAFEHAVGNTLIVPEHIWADVEDPMEDTNEDPVGTGPFLLEDFSQQLYTMTKNEDYWAADEVQVEQLRYPANTDQTFTTSLQSGEIDWSGGFVANVEDIFVARDPDNRGYWYPGGGLVSLTPNTQEAPFDDPQLREALSLAMDREQISEVAMQGYTPPAHPTGLPMPAYESSLSAEYADAAYSRDVEAANDLLNEAGYELGADGVRTTPDGEPMSYPLEIPSDWVDWVTISQLLVEQFAEVGIEITPQGVSFDSWVETRNSGSFDLTISATAIGQSPFDMYRSMMSSEYASDGAVRQNFSRFYDDAADAALDDYAATADEAEQQAALDTLEQVFVEELPLVPMIQSPNWFQYNTERWEGFPNEDDPYAFGAPFQNPDIMIVLRHLTPAQ